MNRIKTLRISHDMKQEDLARELNVARTAISKYERGELDLSSATIHRLCDIFGCTSDYLLGRSAAPTPELTPEEEELLLSWRRATPEIRAIIETALGPYREDVPDITSAPTA